MNDGILDYLLGRARTKAARAGQIVRFTHVGQPTAPLRFDTDEPRGTLAEVIDRGWDDWIVHPSGLCLPSPRVNWFWWFCDSHGSRRDVRLGSAEQALRYAQHFSFDTTRIRAVSALDIHGTCVALNSSLSVQAHSFPHWAGV